MLRFIFCVIFIIPFMLISLLLQPIMLFIGVFNRKARDKGSLAIVLWAFRVILFLAGTKVTVIGEENIPKDKAVLYVLNHRSIFDILLTYVRMPGLTGFVAKKEMGKYLMLTWWMKLLYCEFLDRSDVRKGMAMIKNCCSKIEKGISVAIFPEGTRNKTQEPMLEFHKGSFKIADKTNCPIVPIVLNNTSGIFEDHIPFLRSRHVVIEYLPPVDVASMDREQRRGIAEMVREQMVEAYCRNQQKVWGCLLSP